MTNQSDPLRQTALLVIDVQAGLVSGAHRETETLDAIHRVTSKIRAQNGTVVYIQHCHGSYEPLMRGNPGWAIHSTLDTKPTDIYIEKTASDAFFKTTLDNSLKSLEVEHLVITGLQTEYCVDTTCRSALSHGYDVTLISDGHTTGDAHIPADQIIDHHNQILANVAHPSNHITVVSSAEI